MKLKHCNWSPKYCDGRVEITGVHKFQTRAIPLVETQQYCYWKKKEKTSV
jgi:hypothetical protein